MGPHDPEPGRPWTTERRLASGPDKQMLHSEEALTSGQKCGPDVQSGSQFYRARCAIGKPVLSGPTCDREVGFAGPDVQSRESGYSGPLPFIVGYAIPPPPLQAFVVERRYSAG